MRKAEVYVHGKIAAHLIAHQDGTYEVQYLKEYRGPAISLTIPVRDTA